MRTNAIQRVRGQTKALSLCDVNVDARRPNGSWLRLVEGVSIEVFKGETVALVGESGSGKSVLMRGVAGLLPSGSYRVSGEVHLGGENLSALSPKRRRSTLGHQIGFVFQDPYAALDPVQTVGSQIAEALRAHQDFNRKDVRTQVVHLLDEVGVPDPKARYHAYPHEMSGGMRQRVSIAIAIANKPDVIIADEPTTALDVTIQARIIRLFGDLMRSREASLVFVTHDLALASEVAQRVLVMYGGRVVELGPTEQVLERPFHPYTAGLMGSIPHGTAFRPIPGDPVHPGEWPEGCVFSERCPHVVNECMTVPPEPFVQDSRTAFCHLARDSRPWWSSNDRS